MQVHSLSVKYIMSSRFMKFSRIKSIPQRPVPKYCEKEERSSAERPVPVAHDELHHEHGGSSLVNSWNDCDVCALSRM